MNQSSSRSISQQLHQSWTQLGGGGWQPMLAVHLIFMLGAAVILMPLTGILVQSAVSFSGQEALSDTEIASFLLSPAGAIAGVLLTSVTLTIALMGYAALLVSAHAIQCGERTSLASLFARLALCTPALLRLSVRVIIRYLAVAIPFLLVIGLTYWLLLSGNDINYYLTEKPPEFMAAVAIAALLLLVLGAILIKITIGWYYALPLVLFSKESSKASKIHSKKSTKGQGKIIALWLGLWLFGTPLINFVLTTPISYGANWLVPQLADRLPMLALVLGAAVVINTLISFAVGFICLCLLAHQNIRMFRESDLDKSATAQSPTDVCHRVFRVPLGEKVLLIGGILAVLLIGLISYRMISGIELKDDTLVIAHRGSSKAAPENTMAAIQKAVDDGADWVEIDVQETADGKVVVFHDSDFKRVGGKSLAIWDARSEQLPSIDIGSWLDPKFSKETTPSLLDVLEVCRDKSGVLIELKYYGHDQKLEQRVIDIVEQAKMQDQVMVMSLSYPGVQKVRKLRPDWKIGLLSTVAVGDITKLDVDFLGLNSRAATKRLINRAHKNNIEIFVWTVNDPIDISTMTSRGVDGLITDVPDVALRTLDQRKDLKPSERLMLELAHIFGKRAPSIEQ